MNIDYKIHNPRMINQKHKNQIYELIKSGGQVIDFSVDKFYGCPTAVIAIDINKDEVVGIRIIKRIYDGQIEFFNTNHNFDISKYFELGYLVVHPKYRKQGIASKMLEILLNSLDKNIKLVSMVRVDNEIPKKMLLKNGFNYKFTYKSKYSDNKLELFDFYKK